MKKQGTGFAFGRWGESRGLYSNENFTTADDTEARTVHMGVDLFCAPQTPVYAPLDGVVEIVADNARELDYGPLIILRHTSPDGYAFFTLYGHLHRPGINGIRPGQAVIAGECIAEIGSPPDNGNWPPHLHFQIILDLLGLGADFPGVASARQQDFWLALSPNPARFFAEVDADALDGRRAVAR
jgi:murein DD-endopeptidase MepM/ murein hydrolase activator NlpD